MAAIFLGKSDPRNRNLVVHAKFDSVPAS